MQLFEELNSENWVLFASRHYNNSQCTTVDEFYDDLQRFKYLKRLFRRYLTSGDLQERLILNHLIVLYNVFGIEAGNKICFYRIEEEYWPILKTFLVYLNYLPEKEYVDVPLEPRIVETLRNI